MKKTTTKTTKKRTAPDRAASPVTVEPRPCEECGIEIPIQRLIARPETTLCVKCKEELEWERLHPLRLTS